jgi:predicted unusual protein kinase regulating ubiquinone biosynthesis (AarF/ABC1/UbiB family)
MSVINQINLKELYEIDDHLWLEETIKLLKEKRLNELDLENLIEELESLARRDKLALQSLLEQIIRHLLLLKYWASEYEQNRNHWESEIVSFRSQISDRMTTNFYNYLSENLPSIYRKALKYVQKKSRLDTFPNSCPYSLEQLLDEDWFPQSDENG